MPTITVPPSRRERKKLATREALHDAALALVDERGLAGVTVEDITERADVALRTFFNYYSSKEDAVIGKDDCFTRQLSVALGERPAGEPVHLSVRRVVTDSMVARAVEPAAMFRRIRVIKSEPSLLSRLAAHFEEMEESLTDAVAARLGSDADRDLYPALLVKVTLAASRAAMMHWCDQGGSEPMADALDAAFDRLAGGLADPTPHLATAPDPDPMTASADGTPPTVTPHTVTPATAAPATPKGLTR